MSVRILNHWSDTPAERAAVVRCAVARVLSRQAFVTADDLQAELSVEEYPWGTWCSLTEGPRLYCPQCRLWFDPAAGARVLDAFGVRA